MNRTPKLLATLVSAFAIGLAIDPGRWAFTYADGGGHFLRMRVAGGGRPAVIFETGGSTATGGALEAWERVQPAVSQFAATVSYDRAGIGWSAPGPKPRDARQVAQELHTALGNVGVFPPYVLVGHSFGGPLIRVFADMYPREVAGMVLVDPTQEQFMDWHQKWRQARDPAQHQQQNEEWADDQLSLAEAHQSRVPPGIPVVLITAMGPRVLPASLTEDEKEQLKTIMPMWLKFHNEWLRNIPQGRHIVAEDAGHGIPFESPDLIVDAIRQIINPR